MKVFRNKELGDPGPLNASTEIVKEPLKLAFGQLLGPPQ